MPTRHRHPNSLLHHECHWRHYRRVPKDIIPQRLRPWLLDTGSLTERLTAASNNQFHVEILNHAIDVPRLSECQALGIKPRTRAIIREVILHGANTPWVYARTAIPLTSLTGPLAYLKKPDSRPLGAVLFASPSMRREPMEIGCLTAHNSILPRQLANLNEPLWGRRSVFFLANKPLLVSEIFLPSFTPILDSVQ